MEISHPQITVSAYFTNKNEEDNYTEKNMLSVKNRSEISGNSSDSLISNNYSKMDHPQTRIQDDFFNQDCISLAKGLLGKILVRIVNGVRISGRIVETESYMGGSDVASHSYNNKRTPRNEPMYMKPGTSYVYPIYGMYFCFNISSKGDGSCVLIRALEPLEGVEEMLIGRSQRKKTSTPIKHHDLCNGPSKLCQALAIIKETCNKLDLPTSNEFFLENNSPVLVSEIVICKRIGIESSGPEWANKPLRFYIHNCKFVSVRNKKAEELLYQKQNDETRNRDAEELLNQKQNDEA